MRYHKHHKKRSGVNRQGNRGILRRIGNGGAMAKPALGCDKLNNYSAAVMEKYGASDGACEAVKLLRKTLAEAKEKSRSSPSDRS